MYACVHKQWHIMAGGYFYIARGGSQIVESFGDVVLVLAQHSVGKVGVLRLRARRQMAQSDPLPEITERSGEVLVTALLVLETQQEVQGADRNERGFWPDSEITITIN